MNGPHSGAWTVASRFPGVAEGGDHLVAAAGH
jgi:hypothetical protein